MLIRALPAIRRAIPNLLYVIIGDGEERISLEQLVEQEGVQENVQFLGEANDEILRRCYQQCDVFALPNRQVGVDIEGFGMVLLEAQACGRPVVAGASGGTAETMRVPQTGRIVNCDNPQPLAEVLSELLLQPDLCQRMGVAGRKWVVERFDWTSLTRQAEQIFFPSKIVPIRPTDALVAGAVH
jgi:phosphatidylinositol alpha-1,6-mannosyltransferase